MALDRSKVLDTAQKHLAKGNYDRAIAEYQKLVKDDKNDVRTWLKIGDLYTRKGSRGEACDTYNRVAQHYADQGFFLKAVAVYKQILKLDPSRLDTSLSLADMYEHLQLVSDALNTYETVATAYGREGDIDKVLETLGKMVELDPENIPVRIKFAEALSKAGRTDEAAAAFEEGAGLLKEQGRMDDYIKVAERLLYHRPTGTEVARELAELYLERSDPKRALSKLQLCFKANPREIGTLELLARAFHLLGQIPKTVSVYKEIARVHQDAGKGDARAIVLNKILELDPNDADARQALAGYAPAQPAAQVAPPTDAVVGIRASDPAIEMLDDDAVMLDDDDDDVLIVDEASVEVDVGDLQAAAAEPAEAPSIPPEVAREAQIARLLTECEVFKRYGLTSKVISQLERVMEIAPNHPQGAEQLADAYSNAGRTADAITILGSLADATQDESAKQALIEKIAALDPASEQAVSAFGGPAAAPPEPLPLPVAQPPGPEFIASEPPDPIIEAEEAAEPEDPVLVEEDEDQVLYVDDEPPEPDAPADAEHTVMQAMDPEFLKEALAAAAAPSLPPPAGAPEGAAEGAPNSDALAPMSPEEFEAVPVQPSAPGDLAAAQERVSLPPGEIEEVLEEAEFFVDQGLLEEARATLQDALTTHPDHPLLLDQLVELDRLAEAAAGQAPAAQPTTDDSFLLAEKLAEEIGPEADTGSDVLDPDAVFAQFKKGVADQIGLEDSDTHYDLGIAYKEMGLLDDAIHEFELSQSNPERKCAALSMIGLCHVEKGELEAAIIVFKNGLHCETKGEGEELGLYFELGTTYELLPEPSEALFYFQKVQKRDASFRNVEARIAALGSAPAAAPAPESMDEVDRAFDDLLGDE